MVLQFSSSYFLQKYLSYCLIFRIFQNHFLVEKLSLQLHILLILRAHIYYRLLTYECSVRQTDVLLVFSDHYTNAVRSVGECSEVSEFYYSLQDFLSYRFS